MTTQSDPATKLLIVDDDDLLRRGTQRLMRKAGYQVRVAETGAAAFAALEQERPDLILLDVDLPDINGREICKTIRSDPRYEGIYIVMLSSTRIASNEQALGLEIGADGYIGRPIPNRELVARVDAMLRLKAQENALRSTEIQRLEARRNESVGIMAGGIAHDFNNLLSVIVGNVELAQWELQPDHPASDYILNALEACQWATALTQKFLTLSQCRVPKTMATPVTDLVNGALSELTIDASIQTQMQIDDQLPQVAVDRPQMQQALTCLMQNALEAMAGRGTLWLHGYRATPGSLQSHADLYRSGKSYVAIVIEDSGSGIPTEMMPQIFDPYFSTKEMGARRGMGLGLATANAIIAQQGGALSLDSEIDRGTRVTLFLPLAVSEPKTL